MNKKHAGLDFPVWFDGKDVNEAAFCREFLSKNKLIYADNAFFTPDGRLTDPLLLKEKIYAELECCAAKNIPRTISNIVEIMKLAAHTASFPPKPDEIHVQNGTLRIDGSFLAGRPEIVRSRFPIDYNPQAGKPVVWLRFLSDLLYPEDIPTFQEYIGYCLIPSTKGQRMMILKGEGGEGKSQIGPVLAQLFGCNMKDGSKELPVYRVKRHKTLTVQIAELTEELEELRSEKALLLQKFEYAEDAGAEAFRKDIATMEAGLKKLEAQEQKYVAELDKALDEYAELKAQAVDFDPVELYEARQAIRPAQEKAAGKQLENTMHEKPSLIMLLSAKQETSRLLGEDTEERQARQLIMHRNQEQKRKPRQKEIKKREWER